MTRISLQNSPFMWSHVGFLRLLVASCSAMILEFQLFTSSLYLVALVSSASKACTKFVRKQTILVASIFFLFGAAVSSGAQNIWMLIIGKILLSFGVGFGNEVNENLLHNTKKNCSGDMLCKSSQLWHFKDASIWMESSVPALFLFIGSIVITETPASLIERENETEGKSTLKKIRGVDNVNVEFEQIKAASEIARKVKHPYKELMKLSSMPPLIIGIMLQIFQHLTGINAIMFYALVLFQTFGFKNNYSLLSAVITGIVNMLSTLVSIFYMDKVVRRILLLQAYVQMSIS
ncbi:SOLUTE CARRIER FAMILY 2 FACILITATED GLUCOSE TRANSPORTER [Salix koriyanagi]|uniref:SOLUTE CARRIER FAMILY 2 FACILITATED GLUCOSE TRANSPORTER n=1 Tax=Salix koriyanagi TaxID=2511006 RepID=A0A9Q0WTS5_9ROSI|nr:SOLUTE CARRIER FAMILY 2 FACILITATED GLUCOSE TRANSPORTER [Salix koriyanagi]